MHLQITSFKRFWITIAVAFVFPHVGETLPLSSGNKITLKFTTNGTETAKGFHFVYQGKTLFFGHICRIFYKESCTEGQMYVHETQRVLRTDKNIVVCNLRKMDI